MYIYQYWLADTRLNILDDADIRVKPERATNEITTETLLGTNQKLWDIELQHTHAFSFLMKKDGLLKL